MPTVLGPRLDPATPSTRRSDSAQAPDAAEVAALVARAQAGDAMAFEALYNRTSGRVFAVCVRMSADRQRARELTHDTFVRAWERLGSFRGESAFTSWLHRLAVNVVLEQSRSERRRLARVALAENDEDDERLSNAPAPPAVDTEARIDLERAMAHLPPGARRVFILHDVEGYRHEEIARLIGTAEGTVRAHLHHARKLLMEWMSR